MNAAPDANTATQDQAEFDLDAACEEALRRVADQINESAQLHQYELRQLTAKRLMTEMNFLPGGLS